jgi:hypothetical protein
MRLLWAKSLGKGCLAKAARRGVDMSLEDPIVAIVGNVTTAQDATEAAEDLGRSLAKARFRILVYSSEEGFLESPVVRGYVESQSAKPRSIQVRYPLRGQKPAFPEQQTHAQVFDWRPDNSQDWEMSFYQALKDVDGVLLLGGGDSTLIAGLVAMGHRIAILALASFHGRATKIWEALVPGRDLPSADEISLMARPEWSADLAAECIQSLRNQLARRTEEERQQRLERLRRETAVSWHAVLAVILFLLAMVGIPVAWGLKGEDSSPVAITLLFFSPLLAGVAGSTIRLVFDLRQGTVPLSRQSAITTAALGLIAGGVAGALFVAAQVNILPKDQIAAHAGKLTPFGVAVGFIAGLTLDAVFRKLIASDVLDLSAVDVKKEA